MVRNWVLNCDIDNHKHGFVGEDDVVVRLFFQKSKSANSPRVSLAQITRHLPDDVKAGLARTDVRDGKKGFRLRFVYDALDGNVYLQKNGSSERARVASVPAQFR